MPRQQFSPPFDALPIDTFHLKTSSGHPSVPLHCPERSKTFHALRDTVQCLDVTSFSFAGII